MKCVQCGRPATRQAYADEWGGEVDHVDPWAATNFVPICHRCDAEKGGDSWPLAASE